MVKNYFRSMKYFKLIFFGLLLSFSNGSAQTTFPVNGVHDERHLTYAFKNATIYLDYQTVTANSILLVRDGKVIASGPNVIVPEGSVVYDLAGKFIYPSLIDIYSGYGLPEVKNARGYQETPQMESNAKGPVNWNQAIHAEFEAITSFTSDEKSAEELRKLGFGAVLTHKPDGISRGTGSFVLLGKGKDNLLVIKEKASAHYSFHKGSSTQDYPSSLMGAVALIRQTYLDADWYKNNKNPMEERNISLEAWNNNQSVPQIFESKDKYAALKADMIGDEFKVQFIIKGGGDEYQRINEIKATNASFILPLDFPLPYDVEDPYDALNVSLEELKHWENAPANALYFEKNAIPFAFTAYEVKEKKDLWNNLRKTISFGLSETAALKALTYAPAKMLGMESMIGSLKDGMVANFIITSDSLFSKKNVIHENWIKGEPYLINNYNISDIRGNYDLKLPLGMFKLNFSGEAAKPEAVIMKDTTKLKVNINVSGVLLNLSFDLKTGEQAYHRLSGVIDLPNKKISGKGQDPEGTWFDWVATLIGPPEPEKKDTTPKVLYESGDVFYPFTAYGWKELPKSTTVLIKNATVWTNENEGILNNSDILISGGKISTVGTGLTAPAGAEIIDAKGKHVSAGIIDEHSHIAIRGGVNEGTEAVTAEVRIGDAVYPEDINIYRQLAGGVTAAQLLHGSANPVGGQSALIKLRWGQSPEKMKIEKADGFIKFALGENVKQSNWGDKSTVRFPQSRMGVEQVFMDAFTRAREYQELKKKLADPKAKSNGKILRKDLELEALVEILEKKRFITCHSYVQSEINMLMHVADSMGFKVNTFTHILEGYKVADKMKAHGVGGSSFSDWWAYKFEVNDAIPYNGAILHRMGIITAFNSDDAEMGRRLNQEAAKAVKYGKVSEVEALKFVTLNPAKLLHLDDRMGSIKAGKDADLVIWSDNPLSIYAKAEKTFVDGIAYYDQQRDLMLREEIRKEKSRIIQKLLLAKANGDKVQKPVKKEKKLYECETIENDYLLNE